MSIIPASHLCPSDLSRLGNNLATRGRQRGGGLSPHRRRRGGSVLSAVNRSLAALVGERVSSLHAHPLRKLTA